MQDEMPDDFIRRFAEAPQGSVRVPSDELFPEAHSPIAELYGMPLLSNRGIPLNLDWCGRFASIPARWSGARKLILRGAP